MKERFMSMISSMFHVTAFFFWMLCSMICIALFFITLPLYIITGINLVDFTVVQADKHF